jgi:histidine triad (HIT) family protein
LEIAASPSAIFNLKSAILATILSEGAMLKENLFQKIIDKALPAKVIYEDDRCLAFHDINPQAPTHVLIIPRKVIRTHDDLAEEDAALVGHLHLVAVKLARQLGIADGYRVVVNCRERAGQTVPHLHLHLLGGRDFSWPPG